MDKVARESGGKFWISDGKKVNKKSYAKPRPMLVEAGYPQYAAREVHDF